MKKVLLSLVLASALLWSCNNSSKEEKKETKDTVVTPAPAPATTPATTNPDDSTGKGEQAPPPKTN
jgi:hypothetical protein